MSTKKTDSVELIAIGTVVRPHPKTKGALQEITPGARFTTDAETAKILTSQKPIPAAQLYVPAKEAPSVEEGDKSKKPAAKKPAAKKPAAKTEEKEEDAGASENSEGGSDDDILG